MTFGTFLQIAGWVVVGSIAGYVASLILGAERKGCFIHIALGVAGAIVGAFLIRVFLPGWYNLFGTGAIGQFFNTVFHATVGAFLLLILAELLLPGQQLGMRRSGKKK